MWVNVQGSADVRRQGEPFKVRPNGTTGRWLAIGPGGYVRAHTDYGRGEIMDWDSREAAMAYIEALLVVRDRRRTGLIRLSEIDAMRALGGRALESGR